MTENKLTEAEIMKALEDQKGLYLANGVFAYNALDLINRKNAENEDLQKQLSIFKKLLDKAETKIERLEKEVPNYAVCVKVKNGFIYTKSLEDYDWLIGDISAEAIKEFIAMAVAESFPLPKEYGGLNAVIVSRLFKIAKEMGVEL